MTRDGDSSLAEGVPYGPVFARIYNERWGAWTHRVWPVLRERIVPDVAGRQTWLDLCCGTGLLAELACRAEFRVTGVDRSSDMIEHARTNAPNAEFHVQDVRQLQLEDRFDVVTCIFDSLNYILTPEDLEVVLRRVREKAKPQGQFFFDINTLPGYRQKYVRSQTFEDDGGRWRVDVSTSFDEQTRICRWDVRGHLDEGGKRQSFAETHFQRAWEQCEIDRLLVRQGWEASEQLDGRDFQPARADCPRVIYVVRPRERTSP